MINKVIKLFEDSEATLTTYILQDGEYASKGKKHPAMLVCPGGGYQYVSLNEGEPIALAYNKRGYHGFVLTYSTGFGHPFPEQLKQAAKAMAIIRENANEWNIDVDDISISGFSAGGHLALSLGCFWNEKFLSDLIGLPNEVFKPNYIVVGYPAITLHEWNRKPIDPEIVKLMDSGAMPDLRGLNIPQILSGKMGVSEEEAEYFNLVNHVSKDTPKTFMWVSNEDSLIHPSDLWQFAEKLRENNIDYEMHIFAKGPHGQGLSDDTMLPESLLKKMHLEDWFNLSIKWLKENRELKSHD